MKINKHILWITQTALLVALLVGWQAVSRNIPGTLVTGMGVNFILVIATVVCSLPTGISVAVISPIMAQLAGISPPFPILVPILAAGNIVFVFVWYFIGCRVCTHLSGSAGTVSFKKVSICRIIALVISAIAKFGVIYFGVTVIAVGLIGSELPPPVLAAFGVRQLFTALMGGGLAFLTIPAFNKALPSVQ